jgi:hypothetical protein
MEIAGLSVRNRYLLELATMLRTVGSAPESNRQRRRPEAKVGVAERGGATLARKGGHGRTRRSSPAARIYNAAAPTASGERGGATGAWEEGRRRAPTGERPRHSNVQRLAANDILATGCFGAGRRLVS